MMLRASWTSSDQRRLHSFLEQGPSSVFVIVVIPNGRFCGPKPALVKVSDTWKVKLSVQGRHLALPRDAAEQFSRFSGANVQSKAGCKCEQTAWWERPPSPCPYISGSCSLASYLFHLFALPFSAGASDLDCDGALLAPPAQGHSVGLQRAEGDLQLRPGEAAGSAVLQGDLWGLQHRRTSGALLEAQGAHWSLLSQRGGCSGRGNSYWHLNSASQTGDFDRNLQVWSRTLLFRHSWCQICAEFHNHKYQLDYRPNLKDFKRRTSLLSSNVITNVKTEGFLLKAWAYLTAGWSSGFPLFSWFLLCTFTFSFTVQWNWSLVIFFLLKDKY